MSKTVIELTKIHNGKGADGLSRLDRERIFKFNRRDFLFEKFLASRKQEDKLQLTHENILNLGEKCLQSFKATYKASFSSTDPLKIQNEIKRIESEAEKYKIELISNLQKQFEREQKSLKNSYEKLMQRIEKQRDEAEEERVKDVIKRMNEECDEALRRQWTDLDESRRLMIKEMREIIRKEIYAETESLIKKAVNEAIQKAEEEFKIRESASIEKTIAQCKLEENQRIKELTETYDLSIEKLIIKVNEANEKWQKELNKKTQIESDFRLLQTDYKRFMNYTNHYNSDYMMKLRHIGEQLLEDKEFEKKLNEKIQIKELDRENSIKKTFIVKQ